MTPALRRQIKRILPMLVAEGGRLSFHGVTEDDLAWAESELAGRRLCFAAAADKWPDGSWSQISVEDSVMVGVSVVDFLARPIVVAPGHAALERVSAAFDRGGGSDRPLWMRGEGDPPWR